MSRPVISERSHSTACKQLHETICRIEQQRTREAEWEKSLLSGLYEKNPDARPHQGSVLQQYLDHHTPAMALIRSHLPERSALSDWSSPENPITWQVKTFIATGRWSSTELLSYGTVDWLARPPPPMVSVQPRVPRENGQVPWMVRSLRDKFSSSILEWMTQLYPVFAFQVLRLCSGLDLVAPSDGQTFAMLYSGQLTGIENDAGIVIRLLNFLSSSERHPNWEHESLVGRARIFINRKCYAARILPRLTHFEYRQHAREVSL